MKLLCAVTMTALVVLTCADVSHLGNYNYPAPVFNNLATSFRPPQTHYGPQIESIKSSVELGNFRIHENIGQGHRYSSQDYSAGQLAGAYNYNAPQQQHFSAAVQPHSYGGPSVSVSIPAVGPSPRSYLPPAPQQSVLPVLAPPAAVQQFFQAPPAALPILQQGVPVHVSAPVQQIHYSSAAVVQQQGHVSTGQIQEQSFELSGPQQQSLGGIVSTGLAGNGAYNYQPPVQQQNFPASVPVTALAQQTYSAPGIVQQQSFSSSPNVEDGSYNYQPAVAGPAAVPVQHSFSAPASGEVQQAVTGSLGIESASYNYQPHAQLQQHYTGAVQQQQSIPAAIPVQLAGLGGVSGVDTGSFNYQSPAPAPAPAVTPMVGPQSVEDSVSEPQKNTLPTPVAELTAPAPAPEVGTVYGENGGYVYRKF